MYVLPDDFEINLTPTKRHDIKQVVNVILSLAEEVRILIRSSVLLEQFKITENRHL